MQQPDDPGVPRRPFTPWPVALWFLAMAAFGALIGVLSRGQ